MRFLPPLFQRLCRHPLVLTQRGWGIAFALLLLGSMVYFLGQTLLSSGALSGFDFLRQPAGFEVDAGLFRLQTAQPYWQAFRVGTCNTLAVSLLSIVLASVLGVLLGVGHYAPNALVRGLCRGLVQCVQNIPLLLQLLLWYACLTRVWPGNLNAVALGPFFISEGGVDLPTPVWHGGQMSTVVGLLTGMGLVLVGGLAYRQWAVNRFEATGRARSLVWMPIVLVLAGWVFVLVVNAPVAWDYPALGIAHIDKGGTVTLEFLALWLGLSCHGASLIAETVHSGMARVPHRQIDAAWALGLDRFQTLRLVTLPQALRCIVAPLSKQYLCLVKNSSLAVAVGYPDVLSMATMTLHHTGRVAECITLMLLIYIVIYVFATGIAHVYQRWAVQHQCHE